MTSSLSSIVVEILGINGFVLVDVDFYSFFGMRRPACKESRARAFVFPFVPEVDGREGVGLISTAGNVDSYSFTNSFIPYKSTPLPRNLDMENV
jgi:hypothetical protein